MGRSNLFLTVGIVFLLFAVFIEPAFALTVGVAPATRKILYDTPMPDVAEADLKAARNEWEGFQIVVRSDGPIQGVNVTVSSLEGPNGATIPSENATLYREWYVEIVNDSPTSLEEDYPRDLGFYPDPLVPFFDPYSTETKAVGAPFNVGDGETGLVFVDWHVPLDAAPGTYTGKATLTAEGETAVEIPITLLVWDFDIPQERSFGTAFGFSDNLRDHHGGPNEEATDNYEEIVKRYHWAMHDHRMDLTHIKGQVSFEFDENGDLLPIDWTAYDAYVGPFLSGEYFPDGIPVARFNVGYFRPGRGLGSMTEDQYVEASQAFAKHLQEKGWLEKAYNYAADEPWMEEDDHEYQQIRTDGELLLRENDLWKGRILVTSPWNEIIQDVIGIWCPVTPMYEEWWWLESGMAGREKYAECLDDGQKLWFYACNANVPPYAGYDMDTKIGYEPRIMKWGTWYEKASGFLYWRVNYWVNDDPWKEFLNVESFGETFARNGDGNLLYPGDHNGIADGKGSPDGIEIDGPIVSYRMKQIRDGFEDWEMFILASQLGAEDFVREQVERAYTKFGTWLLEDCSNPGMYCADHPPWTRDEDVLLDAREQVALKVQYLLHPETYTDPEGGTVTDGDVDDETGTDTETPVVSKKDDSGSCRSVPIAGLGGAAWLLAVLGVLRVRRQRQ